MKGRNILTSLIISQRILCPPLLTTLCCPRRMSSGATDWGAVHAGKVAVMTASTKGIGFAVARRLAQQGAHVVLSSRKQENVDKAIQKLKTENLSVSGVICDVGKKEDRENLVEMALEKHGGIDYLFSNASQVSSITKVLDSVEEEWTEVLHVNVTVAFLLVKKVYPYMEKRGGGSIVLSSSVAGYITFPHSGPYCVSKTALCGLTKALAPELYVKNIRLNSLAPGAIKTEFRTYLWGNEALLKRFKEVYEVTSYGRMKLCWKT